MNWLISKSRHYNCCYRRKPKPAKGSSVFFFQPILQTLLDTLRIQFLRRLLSTIYIDERPKVFKSLVQEKNLQKAWVCEFLSEFWLVLWFMTTGKSKQRDLLTDCCFLLLSHCCCFDKGGFPQEPSIPDTARVFSYPDRSGYGIIIIVDAGANSIKCLLCLKHCA